MASNPRRITLDLVKQASQAIDRVFLHSPFFVSQPLSEILGVTLALKIETLNPIRSFKGRGASWLVKNLTSEEPLWCASAGNFGQAMAYACRAANVPWTVYASVNANVLKVERMRAMDANIILFGEDFDAAKAEGRRIAALKGIRFVEDSLDVEPTEGAGTIGLEIAQADIPLDYLIVPLGNGALCAGVATAVKALAPSVKIVAIQAEGAPAMTESLTSGALVTKDRIDTIADGIGVREPVPQALEDLRGLVDDFLLVPDSTILKAMKLLHVHAGLVVEPSGAVGVAGVLVHSDKFAGQRVGTIVCGGNLTEAQMREWLA